MLKRRLLLKHGNRVREIARKRYLENSSKSLEMVKDDIQQEFGSILSSIAVAILVKIATHYILKWLDNRTKTPSKNPNPNELIGLNLD